MCNCNVIFTGKILSAMEAVSRLQEGNDGMHHLCQAQHPPSGLLMINADWDQHSAANRSESHYTVSQLQRVRVSRHLLDISYCTQYIQQNNNNILPFVI